MSRDVVGVSVAGPRPLAGMSREQREAHARLSGLPRRIHAQTPRVDYEHVAKSRSEKSASTKRVRGTQTKGASIWLEGSSVGKQERKR